jgi:hypothetical protein
MSEGPILLSAGLFSTAWGELEVGWEYIVGYL